jgi:hypothetical protein
VLKCSYYAKRNVRELGNSLNFLMNDLVFVGNTDRDVIEDGSSISAKTAIATVVIEDLLN